MYLLPRVLTYEGYRSPCIAAVTLVFITCKGLDLGKHLKAWFHLITHCVRLCLSRVGAVVHTWCITFLWLLHFTSVLNSSRWPSPTWRDRLTRRARAAWRAWRGDSVLSLRHRTPSQVRWPPAICWGFPADTRPCTYGVFAGCDAEAVSLGAELCSGHQSVFAAGLESLWRLGTLSICPWGFAHPSDTCEVGDHFASPQCLVSRDDKELNPKGRILEF